MMFGWFLKATVGYFILTVGSGGLTNTFRPILAGLSDRFGLNAVVIDPYFGQVAAQNGSRKSWKIIFDDDVCDFSSISGKYCFGIVS